MNKQPIFLAPEDVRNPMIGCLGRAGSEAEALDKITLKWNELSLDGDAPNGAELVEIQITKAYCIPHDLPRIKKRVAEQRGILPHDLIASRVADAFALMTEIWLPTFPRKEHR
jgi:hypothetical protein